jgi:hypothetical protein
LRLSEGVTFDNTNTLVWDGNNLEIKGDTVRRLVRAYIAPNVEFAYRVKYPFDPVEYTQKHRVRIVGAVLTLLKAYWLAEEKVALEPLHSFDLWSQWIRGAIVWAGGEDPVASQQEIIEDDEERMQLARIMAGWARAMGIGKFFALELVAEKAGENEEVGPGQWERKHPDFYAVLKEDMRDTHGEISANKLGAYLKKMENRVVEGLKFEKFYNKHVKVFNWKLDEA